MSISEKLYNTFKTKLGDTEAQQLVDFVKSEVTTESDIRKALFSLKEDKANIIRSIYIRGIVQFFAITGSVLVL